MQWFPRPYPRDPDHLGTLRLFPGESIALLTLELQLHRRGDELVATWLTERGEVLVSGKVAEA